MAERGPYLAPLCSLSYSLRAHRISPGRRIHMLLVSNYSDAGRIHAPASSSSHPGALVIIRKAAAACVARSSRRARFFWPAQRDWQRKRWGRGREGGTSDGGGVVVVEGQETRSIRPPDDRSGTSVRHPSEVVVGVDGLGNTPRVLVHSITLGMSTVYTNSLIFWFS